MPENSSRLRLPILAGNMQVAANMAWASNHHGVHKASVLHHTAACVHQMNPNPQQTRTKPQSVSNILYAMAEARYRDLDTIKNLTLWATVHIGLFNDQERANLAWACARLNYSNRELFQALRPHVVAYVAESEAWLNQVHHTGAFLAFHMHVMVWLSGQGAGFFVMHDHHACMEHRKGDASLPQHTAYIIVAV